VARRIDFSVVEAAVWDAVDRVRTHDRLLFSLNASEWSIAHRLAVYLEQKFPSWNVDCEYNRQGRGRSPKKIAGQGIVRPDIMIHRRGLLLPEDNLLVLELKRDSSGLNEVKDRIITFTSPPSSPRYFQYQYGLALVLGAETLMSWAHKGCLLSGNEGIELQGGLK
jgi:hypothetical protein